MLGLDFSEILIIGVVALVVVGPKELPAMLRVLGQWVAKARSMANEFQGQMNEALREAELDGVKKQVDDLRSLSPKNLIAAQLASVTDAVTKVEQETNAEIAKVQQAFATPSFDHGGAATPGGAMSAFMVEDEPAGPAMAEHEVAARIDAAADGVAVPMPSIEVAAAEPVAAEPVAAEVAVAGEKKELGA